MVLGLVGLCGCCWFAAAKKSQRVRTGTVDLFRCNICCNRSDGGDSGVQITKPIELGPPDEDEPDNWRKDIDKAAFDLVQAAERDIPREFGSPVNAAPAGNYVRVCLALALPFPAWSRHRPSKAAASQ